MLQVAQCLVLRLENPKALNVATGKMPGVEEFCTRKRYFESEEVFGSEKYKVDISLGFEHKSHWPYQVNFSLP